MVELSLHIFAHFLASVVELSIALIIVVEVSVVEVSTVLTSTSPPAFAYHISYVRYI